MQSSTKRVATSAEMFPPTYYRFLREVFRGKGLTAETFHLNNFMREYVSSLRAWKKRERERESDRIRDYRAEYSFDVHLVHGSRTILLRRPFRDARRNLVLSRVERNRWKTSDPGFSFLNTPTDLETASPEIIHGMLCLIKSGN